MVLAAAAVALVLLLLAVVVPDRLARAGWPQRAPVCGLLLWQALALAAWVLPVELAVTLALAPAGETHTAALQALLDGRAELAWWSVPTGVLAALLVARLLSVLLAAATRTLRARRRNRVLVDLLATRNPLLARVRVVDHAVPLAYCLPGLRPRVVVSRGALDLLRDDEVRAVLAHESAHVDERHDLVVLPFLALGATFPRLRGVRTARTQVALLVEMLADDRASRRHPPEVLARALCKVGLSPVPPGALGAGGDGVLLRAQRLVRRPAPLGRTALAAVTLATALVLALPLLALVVPLAGAGATEGTVPLMRSTVPDQHAPAGTD